MPSYAAYGLTPADRFRPELYKRTGRSPTYRHYPTPEVVRLIRQLHADGSSQAALARQFAMSLGAVAGIVHRRRWVHD